MSFDKMREQVLEANLSLVEKNLVISTWGNVSGYDEESGLVFIKASGVPYSKMQLKHIVPVDLDGNVVDSPYMPSTDLETHLVLYRAWKDKGVRGIVHTHSQFATTWAQLAQSIPIYGTTHADYFVGDIPCTRLLTPEEIEEGYELNTGKVILETFENIVPKEMPAVLVHSHAPFSWGATPEKAVLHSEVLEYVARMAIIDYLMSGGKCPRINEAVRSKHYNRKFGENAYYGQKTEI